MSCSSPAMNASSPDWRHSCSAINRAATARVSVLVQYHSNSRAATSANSVSGKLNPSTSSFSGLMPISPIAWFKSATGRCSPYSELFTTRNTLHVSAGSWATQSLQRTGLDARLIRQPHQLHRHGRPAIQRDRARCDLLELRGDFVHGGDFRERYQ